MLNELNSRRVLIIEDEAVTSSHPMSGAIDRLAEALAERGMEVESVASCREAAPLVETDMDIDCFLVASDMDLNAEAALQTTRLLKHLRRRRGDAPVFLLADRAAASRAMDRKLMEMATEFAWIFEDSSEFLADRVQAAIERYRAGLLPPLMRAMWEYNEKNHEYSWAAPGHQGGVGFTKSPVGKKFYDFYGQNLFRTDTGIERGSIGSLLDHTGAFGESERVTARVFGADNSYSVVVGTSGSNRTVMQICLKPNDIAVCDRNCHKSIEQGLILTGALPVYMAPTRNRYGIIGPVRRPEMTADAVKAKVSALKKRFPHAGEPVYSVVTNCTYDGLCYNASKVEPLLAASVKRVHFDEAWYGYARFNPMYADHFAMRGDPSDHRGATVFATHSTHKLLNALSQASHIHVRQGDDPIPPPRFNQAYMMHATTSPLYAICASNDISTAMMSDCGEALTSEVIEEAVDFRQTLAKLCREYEAADSWFFKPWNPSTVSDGNGKVYDFPDAPRELLATRQECWRLEPNATWHGFKELEDNWVMLDPIKVSILSPGMGDDGKMLEKGVPAALVSAYIYSQGIVPTRTTDFQLMFLFSMGITRGKWGTLLNALMRFKEFYDANTPVEQVLPDLASRYPEHYLGVGLRDLGDRIFNYLRTENPNEKLDLAFASLPEIVLSPRDAYMKIVADEVEMVPLDKLSGRVAACSLIPYPPGIPMIISGESFGSRNSPQISYLQTLEAWDAKFPGFEHETEGAEVVDGKYHVMCIRE